MNPTKPIQPLLAQIVTGIAFAFPIAYLLSITVTSGRNKLLHCTWNNGEESGTGAVERDFLRNLAQSDHLLQVVGVDAEGRHIQYCTTISRILSVR